MIVELERTIKDLLKDFNKNIVIYSAVYPFVNFMNGNPVSFCNDVIDIFTQNADTVFMPTFTDGFTNGICNLDKEKSLTGALTEIFRNTEGVKRTFCPFFSFGVYGKYQKETVALRPKEAWGSGSLYEWFYNNDVTIVTFGTHLTHCSFTHYAEWLMRDKITYRYNKDFSGKIILDGQEENCKTTLFVRQLNPSPHNNWMWAIPNYLSVGMNILDFHGIQISAISARNKIDCLLPLVEKDNYCLIDNKESFIKKGENEYARTI